VAENKNTAVGTGNTLSVIIPNYNKSLYIGQTLDSIINQTRRPDEIIVVDDCSTDTSREVLERYQAAYPKMIHVFFLGENGGVQHARNYGFSQSTSDYITFIDSDDFYYAKDKLENEMQCVGKDRIVCSDFVFFDQQMQKYRRVRNAAFEKWEFKRATLNSLVNCRLVNLWPYAYIISREAFEKVNGYDFPYNLYEDLDIIIKLILRGCYIVRTNRMGRAYRVNDQETAHLSLEKKEKHALSKRLISERYSGEITTREKLVSGLCKFPHFVCAAFIKTRLVLTRFYQQNRSKNSEK